MVDVEWFERQRVFQAQALSDTGASIDHMWFRTTVGPADAASPRPLGRVARAALLAVAGAAVVGLLLVLDVARIVPAAVASLWGGFTLVAALAGPEPRGDHGPDVALLALWPRTASAGDRPVCVAPILATDRRRLGVDGEVTVVGRARADSNFGVFADDHLVWPQARPRRARPEDPALGD